MPTDSAGNFTLDPRYFAEAGTTIRVEQHNPILDDIAQALSQRLMRDGRNGMVGDLSMGTFRVRNVGQGEAPNDVAIRSDLDAINEAFEDLSTSVEDQFAALTPWIMQPIGVPVPIFSNLAGVAAPPTNDERFRYVKLTASDSYNSGVLTSQSVSGTAPLISATAIIALNGSPLNGQTIRLINTERRFLRAGSPGVLQDDAFQGHWHSFQRGQTQPPNNAVTGAQTMNVNTGTTENDRVRAAVSDGSNGTPRIANETRSRNLGVDFFLRIL